MTVDRLIDDFELLDDWEDRYRTVIELGRGLEPLPESLRTEANKVRGCASQVWLATNIEPAPGGGAPVLRFRGDSDALIVRGLIAILFMIYSGRPADRVLATDGGAIFDRLGLRDHLTQQRSNGLASMMERMRVDARSALKATV